MPALASGSRVVVIGGGVIGLSVAYHLAKKNAAEVILLERNQLTSGTSWHAAGIIGPLRASMNLTRLAIYATELFPALESETGQATGYRRTGGYWLAQSADRMIELRRIAAMGEMTGLEARMLARDEIAEALPLLRCDDLAGGLWVAEDGQANPVDLCMAFAKGARQAGATIREGVTVAEIQKSAGAVTAVATSSGERIACDAAVICGGVWSRQLGALAGVPVPVQAAEHMYVVTEPMADLPDPFPILRDLEGRIYIKGDAGKLVLGGFEANAKPWDSTRPEGSRPYLILPEDWDQFAPFMTAGLNRVPALETAGIQHFMNGPEGFTPDTRQAMGEAPGCRNLFVAAGFNSIGIVSSAGAGRVMADWVLEGAAPMDLWEVDIARFEPETAARAFLQARLPEAVANQFELHWPYKQMKTGRDLKHTPLHETWAAAGAVFGETAGWERPFWFARTPEERALGYSYGDQPWWPLAERETRALCDGVVLLELTPFGKFEVAGPDAEGLLQRLCANDVAVAPGRLVYGQLLNPRGGIEADVTIARLAPDRFRVVSGAATRMKDLAWLRRGQTGGEQVVLDDVTTRLTVLGVMGPRARDLLTRLSAADFSDAAFPFASAREVELGQVPVLASRLSFVGELGWELTVRSDRARRLYDLLCAAGEDPGLGALGLGRLGHLALDGCRLEKGYRHWGHDIGPDDTPLEAGLGFAVAFDKPGGFIGREALLRQREAGLQRRLLLFRAEGHPLLLHDEPIYRAGRLVGRTTSGGRGFRTNLSLCFGVIACDPGETLADLRAGPYEVGVAGERFALTALARPPYDPAGERLRS